MNSAHHMSPWARGQDARCWEQMLALVSSEIEIGATVRASAAWSGFWVFGGAAVMGNTCVLLFRPTPTGARRSVFCEGFRVVASTG
jgi:hypothetical protein